MADPAAKKADPHPKIPEREEDLMGKTVGLVLAGGGARGAYELGALSVLLPRLEKKYGRPKVIVGTSAGALNTAYLAATADEKDLRDALEEGCQIWREINWDKVANISWKSVGSLFDTFHVPGAHSWSLLESSPLRKTLASGHLSDKFPKGMRFERIHANVENGDLDTAAVAATRGVTSHSVIFCDRREELGLPDEDPWRGIQYQRVELGVDHVMASAAIPSVFPAHQVPSLPGWYQDGGTRLNAPISPALLLGVELLIIVALHSPYLGKTPNKSEKELAETINARPETLDGAAQIIQGLLIDPLINDLHTLAKINILVKKAHAAADKTAKTEKDRKAAEKQLPKEDVIPYILIAPGTPDRIGRIATSCYDEHYKGLRMPDTLGALGWFLDVGDNDFRGELFSNLFFDGNFAAKLIDAGKEDARAWLAEKHDIGPWQVGKLPDPTKQAAAGARSTPRPR